MLLYSLAIASALVVLYIALRSYKPLSKLQSKLGFTSNFSVRRTDEPAQVALNAPNQIKVDTFKLVSEIRQAHPEASLTWNRREDGRVIVKLAHPDGNVIAITGNNTEHANTLLWEKVHEQT